jgi:hypothetical protein
MMQLVSSGVKSRVHEMNINVTGFRNKIRDLVSFRIKIRDIVVFRIRMKSSKLGEYFTNQDKLQLHLPMHVYANGDLVVLCAINSCICET